MTDIQPIKMPKWGLAMEEGMVAKWMVDEGAAIAHGQEIMDIETSKIAAFCQEAGDSGVVCASAFSETDVTKGRATCSPDEGETHVGEKWVVVENEGLDRRCSGVKRAQTVVVQLAVGEVDMVQS